jgi:hypothetical protein
LGSCDLLKDKGSVGGALRPGIIFGAKDKEVANESAEMAVRH